MSWNCSELGLRIALCDLIERLKRCEQKCSYLEECRHELIKEVMRLRLENQWLSNTTPNNNNLMSESNQLALNSNPFNQFYNNNNNLMIRSLTEVKSENKIIDKNNEYNTNGTDLDKEENDWQQITVKLLEDLQRDLAGSESGDTPKREQTFGDNPITNTLEENFEDKELFNKNKETVITINDSLTHSEPTLMDDKNYLMTKRHKQSNTMENTALNGFNNSSYSSVISDKNIVFNKRNENYCEEQNSERNRNTNYSTLFRENPIDNNIEYIKAFSSAVSYLKKDLNQVFQALTTQNEKLNKLKAKQLRNYFKRQLNFDQNFHQTSTPLKIDPKFNHQNY